MKNFFKFLLIFILSLLTIAGGWFLYLTYGPKSSIEDILPANALTFMRLSHPSGHLHNVQTSEFWKNIETINVSKVLARNNVPKARIRQIEHWRKQAVGFLQSPLTQQFLGKEIAVAVYLKKGIDPLKDPDAAYGTVGVLRLLPSIQMADDISPFAQRWGDKIAISKEKYQGLDIVHVKLKKQNVLLKYVRLGDLLVVTGEKSDILNKVIDTFQKKRPALGHDKDFKFVKSRSYAGADGLAYLNIQEFKNIFKSLNDDPLSISGFKTYAVSFLPGSVKKYKFIVNFEPEAMGPTMRQVVSCAPAANLSLNLIPADAIFYQWGGCYDFPEIVKQVMEQVRSVGEPDRKIAQVKHVLEKQTGLKVDRSILTALGSEAGVYVTDVDTLGMMPYPRFLAFVKVKDQSKLEAMLGQVTRTPFGPVDQEDYNQTKIRFAPLPLGSNMDPGYGFVGDYLLVASSRQLLKKSIDIYKQPEHSLGSDKAFRMMGLDSSQKVQSVLFIKVQETARRLKGLMDWGNKFFSSQVSTASLYKREGMEKKKELTAAIAAAEEEKKKLSDTQEINDRITSFKSQQRDIDDMLLGYKLHTESAKLFMFNTQQVLAPLLRGIETINYFGARVTVEGKIIETELMFN